MEGTNATSPFDESDFEYHRISHCNVHVVANLRLRTLGASTVSVTSVAEAIYLVRQECIADAPEATVDAYLQIDDPEVSYLHITNDEAVLIDGKPDCAVAGRVSISTWRIEVNGIVKLRLPDYTSIRNRAFKLAYALDEDEVAVVIGDQEHWITLDQVFDPFIVLSGKFNDDYLPEVIPETKPKTSLPRIKKKSLRTVGIVGAAAIVLAVGATVAVKAVAPESFQSETAATQVEAQFPNAGQKPLRTIKANPSQATVSNGGGFIAVQHKQAEITIYSLKNGKKPEKKDGAVIKLKGKLTSPVQPLSPGQNDGFIIHTSGDNGKGLLTVWTSQNGVQEHELKAGTAYAARGPVSWLYSTVPSTTAAEIKMLQGKGLKAITASSSGASFFGLGEKDSYLWAAVNSEGSPRIVVTDAEGNEKSMADLVPPVESASVERWVHATGKYAVMLWSDYVEHLAIHDVNTGEVVTSIELPEDALTDDARIQLSSDQKVAVFADTRINLDNPSLETLDTASQKLTPTHAGVITTDADGNKQFTSTLKEDLPPITGGGEVLTRTKEVTIFDSENELSVYENHPQVKEPAPSASPSPSKKEKK